MGEGAGEREKEGRGRLPKKKPTSLHPPRGPGSVVGRGPGGRAIPLPPAAVADPLQVEAGPDDSEVRRRRDLGDQLSHDGVGPIDEASTLNT